MAPHPYRILLQCPPAVSSGSSEDAIPPQRGEKEVGLAGSPVPLEEELKHGPVAIKTTALTTRAPSTLA
eukprot:10931003-Heterocapsa_arctica.AAC.1